jgi:hypothetical protein
VNIDLKSPLQRLVGTVVGLVLFIVAMEIRGCIQSHADAVAHKLELKTIDAELAKGQKLDGSKVADSLQDLVPLAEKWGWHSFDYRARVAEKATPNERLELRLKMGERKKDIVEWVNAEGPKSGVTKEIVAFVALCDAAEEVAERYK